MATVSTELFTTTTVEPVDPKWDPNCPGCLSGIAPDPYFCPGCLSGIGPDPDDPIEFEDADVARASA
jgi:hypothetical protein